MRTLAIGVAVAAGVLGTAVWLTPGERSEAIDQAIEQAIEQASAAPAVQPATPVRDVISAPPLRYDLVRVEADGDALIAGRSEGMSKIMLRSGQTTLAESVPGPDGSFVLQTRLAQSLVPQLLTLTGLSQDGVEFIAPDRIAIGPVLGPDSAEPASPAAAEPIADPNQSDEIIAEVGAENAIPTDQTAPVVLETSVDEGSEVAEAPVANEPETQPVAAQTDIIAGRADPDFGPDALALPAQEQDAVDLASLAAEGGASLQAAERGAAPDGVDTIASVVTALDQAPIENTEVVLEIARSDPEDGGDLTTLIAETASEDLGIVFDVPALGGGDKLGEAGLAVLSCDPDTALALLCPQPFDAPRIGDVVALTETNAPVGLLPGADPQTDVVALGSVEPLLDSAGTPSGESDWAAQTLQAGPVLLAGADGVQVIQPGGAAGAPQVHSVAIDTITYDPQGEVYLAGRATDQGFVRVYLDNEPITASRVSQGGAWRTDLPDVDTGVYTLRVDEISAQGEVLSRLETAFRREEPELIAEVMADQTEDEDFSVAVRVIQPGNTLWAIAEESYGDGILYVQVFEANRELIRDPDLIYPGQIFRVPELEQQAQ